MLYTVKEAIYPNGRENLQNHYTVTHYYKVVKGDEGYDVTADDEFLVTTATAESAWAECLNHTFEMKYNVFSFHKEEEA